MKRGLVWFKNDLRLHDNEALTRANQECEELIYCYCIEKSNFENKEFDFRKAGVVRFKFLEQAILDLQQNLAALNAHLVIGENSPLHTLPELITQYHITDVYAEEEYASEERDLIGEIKKR